MRANLFATLVVLWSFQAMAEEAAVPAPVTPPPKVLGWQKSANIGANVSLSSSQDVVGQNDGSTQTYGLNFKGNLNRVSEGDEWRNGLTILENTTKTPAVPRFAKSGDEVKLNTTYLYSLPNHPDFGPYVKGEVSAPMFKGEDLRPTLTTYLIKNRSNPAGAPFTGTSLRLTDSFRPLNTSESVGMFWKAVTTEKLKVEARLGFGALQINAVDQYAVTGTDAATGFVNVQELSNVNQAGLEAALSVKGKIDEKSSYEAGVETLTPFINNKAAGDDRDAMKLTNVDGFAKFNTNITSWAGLSYDYKLKLQPQLLDRAQQIHMVVLNINYNLF